MQVGGSPYPGRRNHPAPRDPESFELAGPAWSLRYPRYYFTHVPSVKNSIPFPTLYTLQSSISSIRISRVVSGYKSCYLGTVGGSGRSLGIS